MREGIIIYKKNEIIKAGFKILMFIIFILLMVGCSRKENKITQQESTNTIISAYGSYSIDSAEREGFFMKFDFLNNEMFLRKVKGEDETFKIKNPERIKEFLLTYIEMDYSDNYDVRKNGDTQLVLWSLNIQTKNKVYIFRSLKEYPDNWNEFLNMLNEETGANLKIPTQKQ